MVMPFSLIERERRNRKRGERARNGKSRVGGRKEGKKKERIWLSQPRKSRSMDSKSKENFLIARNLGFDVNDVVKTNGENAILLASVLNVSNEILKQAPPF